MPQELLPKTATLREVQQGKMSTMSSYSHYPCTDRLGGHRNLAHRPLKTLVVRTPLEKHSNAAPNPRSESGTNSKRNGFGIHEEPI